MPETVVHFQIRMPPVLHERLASWAIDKKISLNAAVVTFLKEALERRKLGFGAGQQGPIFRLSLFVPLPLTRTVKLRGEDQSKRLLWATARG